MKKALISGNIGAQIMQSSTTTKPTFLDFFSRLRESMAISPPLIFIFVI